MKTIGGIPGELAIALTTLGIGAAVLIVANLLRRP